MTTTDAVTDARLQERGTLLEPASRHVTDIGTNCHNMTVRAAIRNVCHYCRQPIALTELLWRRRMQISRTGEFTTRTDGGMYPRSVTVSACGPCAEREMPAWAWWWSDKPFDLKEHGDGSYTSHAAWILSPTGTT